MSFNSYGFLLGFLPAIILVYWLVAVIWPGRARLCMLILASLLFYLLAARAALALLIISMLGNFACARLLLGRREIVQRRILGLGVAANVLLLIYFKYSGLMLATVGLGGQDAPLAHLILPLGLSFFTFQQIAFLVDTAHRRISPAHPVTYIASILFFPTLLAGPITYYREFAPQAEASAERGDILSHISVGSVLFILGLFKKVVIGDSLALWNDPLFEAAASGQAISPLLAWLMAAAYLLQLYFDFSGYSDMALGCARMVGIRLPLNFMSPLRVTNIIDWWRRWHMSLGRFVGDHIFQPIALPLTRLAMRRRLSRWPAHILSVLAPTFLAMLVIGIWHGANLTFLVFGVLHGLFMVVAESWRFMRPKRRRHKSNWPVKAAGNIATLLAVIITMVPFRADNLETAIRLWRAMFGQAGAVPFAWPAYLPLPGAGGWGYAGLMLIAYVIAMLLPNSAQFLERFEPALDWDNWRGKVSSPFGLTFSPGLAWGCILGIMGFAGLALVARGTGGFVYAGY